MDPNAALNDAIELARGLVERGTAGTRTLRLAELVLALDGWMCGGGFLPDRWRAKGSGILTASTPGIHAIAPSSSNVEPHKALCGSDGVFGSDRMVTCPQCKLKLLDGRIERLTAQVAECIAELARLGEVVEPGKGMR